MRLPAEYDVFAVTVGLAVNSCTKQPHIAGDVTVPAQSELAEQNLDYVTEQWDGYRKKEDHDRRACVHLASPAPLGKIRPAGKLRHWSGW
jgi:hypothetical protein